MVIFLGTGFADFASGQTVGSSFQEVPSSPPEFQKNQAATQFDPQAAFDYLQEICDIGPRISATEGMRKQQAYIQDHFKGLDGKIYNQPFSAKSPFTQRFVRLHNIIVRWHEDRKRRILICCHHDTRPFPDQDPVNPRGTFIGANDGASGVALLCELGKHIEAMEGPFGVDFIFFDGEEFVLIRPRDPMFLGSTYFANQYRSGRVKWKYDYGILVDMVADKDLQIYYEGNSLGYADGLTRSVWTVAKRLGIQEFIPQKRHQIRDDHLPLNSIAGIRTTDIIDFDFPNPKQGNAYWHTEKDIPENCSADSLGKVGTVVLEWLREMQRLNSK
ncbi:MAG: M28 family peptidase [Planctomycetota bacterium]